MTGRLLVLVLAWAAAPEAGAQATPPAGGHNAVVRDGLARLRAATAASVSLDSAVAAGYARDLPRCYAHPEHGAMGFHHLNRAYVDARVKVERPETLLCERRADGRYALNGVEYTIPCWPGRSRQTCFARDLISGLTLAGASGAGVAGRERRPPRL